MPSDIVVQAASLLPPGQALDVACGTGRHTIYLRALGWTVTPVDRSTSVPGALILDLELTPLPFPDDSFDLIVMTLYLHRALWPTIRRLLRTGGLLATSAKLTGRFAASPGELLTAFAGWEVVGYREGEGVASLLARKKM